MTWVALPCNCDLRYVSFCTALKVELVCTAVSKLSQRGSHESASPADVVMFSLGSQITFSHAAASATVPLSSLEWRGEWSSLWATVAAFWLGETEVLSRRFTCVVW